MPRQNKFLAMKEIFTHNTTMVIGPRESAVTMSSNNPSTNFLAPFIVFLILFLLSLFVIGYLIYRLRKIKKEAKYKSPFQPYLQSLSVARTIDIAKVNSTFKDDSASMASSFSSSPSNNFTSTPREPELPHITPLSAQVLKQVEIPIHEELEKVIPYQYSTPFTQQWNATDIHETLSIKQIRVENWLHENEEKKCGVGEVNLGNPVACFVKVLKGTFKDKSSISDDLASISHVLYYKSCDHPNLVKFYGLCLSKDALYSVSEFVSSRSLLNVLISSRTLDHSAVISTMSGAQLMNFAISISNALFYLHANQLVHGSLNANHVLLNDRFTPKLYNCCGENSKRSKLKSRRWCAPEVEIAQQYTEKADVWSFGVLVWEILSLGGQPFCDKSEENVTAYIRKQLQTGGSILPITRNSTKRLWLLLQSCWSQNSLDRPDILEVKLKLKKMKEQTNAITVAKSPGYIFFPIGN